MQQSNACKDATIVSLIYVAAQRAEISAPRNLDDVVEAKIRLQLEVVYINVVTESCTPV